VSTPLEPLAAPQTLAAHTRRAVLAAIADGRLEPGGRYSVAQLAEQLGISRTPVREALLVLEREGRVKFERNRGVRILETTADDVAEVFELRLLLEVPAAAKACGSVDTGDLEAALAAGDSEAFHDLILLAAGNRRLAAIVGGLRELLGRHAARDAAELEAEHRAILAALEAGDAERAAAAMRYHLRRTAELVAATRA
jgi:DNA-binding GntR family transcriptional regulator